MTRPLTDDDMLNMQRAIVNVLGEDRAVGVILIAWDETGNVKSMDNGVPVETSVEVLRLEIQHRLNVAPTPMPEATTRERGSA